MGPYMKEERKFGDSERTMVSCSIAAQLLRDVMKLFSDRNGENGDEGVDDFAAEILIVKNLYLFRTVGVNTLSVWKSVLPHANINIDEE